MSPTFNPDYIVDGFIRLSVGIEDLADLRADLEAGFKAAAR
jgi:cystathionine beta-lyase/cystathionine gamma-synthase